MIAPEGKVILLPAIIVICLLIAAQSFLGYKWIAIPIWISLLFLAFSLYFFRDPKRVFPSDHNLFISPADGKIVQIIDVDDPAIGAAKQMSIFLSVFNVHLQRVPFDAKVLESHYNRGKFFAAWNHKASLDNEQTNILFETGDNTKFRIKQIAGFVARRILCYMEIGQAVERGQRLGFIRFGSRVDIVVPADFQFESAVGEKVIGGESIIGRFNAN